MPKTLMHVLNKKSDFIERTCTLGHNHSLRFFVDEATGKVDLLKMSLTPQSRFVEINYVLGNSRISCWKEGEPYYIEIERVLDADFPNLTKLRDKVSLYVIFS
jgi:hypothetical protein